MLRKRLNSTDMKRMCRSLQKIVEGMVEGTRGRGRRRISWVKNVDGSSGMKINECCESALEQERWNIQFGTKVKVLRAYVLSVLMYGSECWTISKEMEKRLLAIEMWFLRRIFRISWTERKTNEEVLHLHGTDRSLLQMIRKRQMEFLGHINRHDGLEKLMLHGKVEGKRARGRQRQTFMDSLSRFTNASNKNLSKLEIFRRTEDREAWKSLIVDVCARPDTWMK
ncbi:hypothetical protein EGW08_011184 [Elysia chlorotica]|uniref:Reverse transcriptase domain-containing protein n=1 Tax=Elysia chlorotica TaxID=188477 RepID=A0A3S1A2L0_ELYCH|nr:hypothetical protein EGW08_011184 [Elysia chlorotica]